MQQVSSQQIIFIVLLITIMSLIVIGFILSYVRLFNIRKRSYIEDREKMQERFQVQLLQAQLETQEQTFSDISKELHDNVGQLLSLSSLQLSLAISHPQKETVSLEHIKKNVDEALKDLRNISKSLNGEYMQQFSISEFLYKLKEQLDNLNTFEFEVFLKEEEHKLIITKKIILLRVIQECFQNVVKHAQAKKLRVTIDSTVSDNMQLIFEDDGKGFDFKNAEKMNGLGMKSIQQRVALLDGKIDVNSTIGKGTIITINIPIK